MLTSIALLFKEARPFLFFSAIALVLFFLSMFFGVQVVAEFMGTGMLAGKARAVLSASIMLCAVLSLVCGIFLDSISRGRLEQKRIAYLSMAQLPQ